MQQITVVFQCPAGHTWKEPTPPNPKAPAMLALYGTCPVCPGRVQGTAKG